MNNITPIAGTEIVFSENKKWFCKNHSGNIINCDSIEYRSKNLKLYSSVIVRGLDDLFDNLNPEASFTIVKNISLLGSMAQYIPQPANAMEWISFKHYTWLAQQSMGFFCAQASVFYIMTKTEEEALTSHVA